MASEGDKMMTGPSRVMALVATVAALCGGAAAQSGCFSSLVGLVPCLSFLAKNSSATSSWCCSQVASVVQSQPQCLSMFGREAQLFLNGSEPSLNVILNQTISMCRAGSPKSSPSDLSGGSVEVPPADGYSTGHGVAKMPPLPLAVLSVLMAMVTFGYVPILAI
ncbi:hypothetical protein BT93_L3351 [Corymbia citriodora subsp. variegata]|uniref:Bifunctional inhibitor/plant lipid transfer protein/seed storage helical domain-containing protein n=1 Tax=Corymbia citriodora subsp. variegata TaxID=360336 RepID=A0A8T0CJZ1_CORYI|nr:hypothetical protein BT93_L3351 [Corymbia citriodora subsp. variegata]